jgi:diphthamide biosynthesis protein 2
MSMSEQGGSDDEYSSSAQAATPAAVTAPPPRLQFDEGTRIMEEGGVDSSVQGAVQAPQPITQRHTVRPESTDLETYYELSRTCRDIVQGLGLGTKASDDNNNTNSSSSSLSFLCRVALQFPDELLGDATEVCWRIEQGLLDEVMNMNMNSTTLSSPTLSPPPPLVFVLGDTTHGSCCVDTVAAQHLQADWIVHYGRACLTPATSGIRTTTSTSADTAVTAADVPVTFVFGRGATPLDTDQCARDVWNELQQQLPDNKDDNNNNSQDPDKAHMNLIVMYDVPYHYAMLDLEAAFIKNASSSELNLNLIMAQLPSQSNTEGQVGDNNDNNSYSNSNRDLLSIGGLHIPISLLRQDKEHDDTGDNDNDNASSLAVKFSDYTLLYVGSQDTPEEERHLMNVLLRCSGGGAKNSAPRACWVYNPTTSNNNAKLNTDALSLSICRRTLQRRFYYVQKAKTASVFGIVVGTLTLDGFQGVVSQLQTLIEASGRSCYTFAVGKLNPAKLGNFGDLVECFVLVSCPEHSLLENASDYPIPVITPLECAMALGAREWDGFYSLDCIRDFYLNGSSSSTDQEGDNGNENDNDATDADSSDDDSDAPFFDVTTGKYVVVANNNSKSSRRQIIEDEKKQLNTNSLTIESATKDMNALVVAATDDDKQLMEYTAHSSAAVQVWNKREYQGLRADIGRTEVAAATPGKKGIASSYSDADVDADVDGNNK